MQNTFDKNVVRGKPIEVIDLLGNALSMFQKIILWCPQLDNHMISGRVEKLIREFLEYHSLNEVKVRLNQYAPHEEFLRVFTSKKVHWFIRIPLGLIYWIFYLMFPNRIFGGDFYNPYTNTANIFSDHPAIALHELGHALDFERRKHRGLYSLLRVIPFVALYQEFIASKYAISFLRHRCYHADELAAYKILYPAYSTYLFGSISDIFPSPILAILYLPVILIGHIAGRLHAVIRSRQLGGLKNIPKEQPEESKPRTIPLTVTFCGLLLGWIFSDQWWVPLVTAVLAYYAYIEVMRYRGLDDFPIAHSNKPSKIEELSQIRTELEQYDKTLSSFSYLLGEEVKNRACKRLSSLIELANKIRDGIENGLEEEAAENYKKLLLQIRNEEDITHIRDFVRICRDYDLRGVYELRNHRRLKKLTSYLATYYKHNFLIVSLCSNFEHLDRTVLTIYHKAESLLSRSNPQKALECLAQLPETVREDKEIIKLAGKAKSQLNKSRQYLSRAFYELDRSRYSRAIRYAKKAATLDICIQSKAQKLIKKASFERKKRKQRIALALACSTLSAYLGIVFADQAYDYMKCRMTYTHIQKLPSGPGNIENKIKQLKLFIAEYPTSHLASSAKEDLKNLTKIQETYAYNELSDVLKDLENSKQFHKAATALKTFLESHPTFPNNENLRKQIQHYEYLGLVKTIKDASSSQDLNAVIARAQEFITNYPDTKYKDDIDKAVNNARSKIAKADYLRLLDLKTSNFRDKLSAYRDFLATYSGSEWAKKVQSIMMTDIENYYLTTKANIERAKVNNNIVAAISMSDAFIQEVKYGEHVNKMLKIKHQLLERKKYLEDYARLLKQERQFGEDYEQAKKMFQHYLSANPGSCMRSKIRDRIKLLDEKNRQKIFIARLNKKVNNHPDRLSDSIRALQKYLQGNPLEPYRTQAASLLNELRLKHRERLKKLEDLKKKRIMQAEERGWKQLYSRIQNPSLRYSDRVKLLEEYLANCSHNSRHKMEAVKLINSMRFPLKQERAVELQLQSLRSRFGLNGDGTFTDRKTGLMWVVLDSLQITGGGSLSYSAAQAYVSALRVGGYKDWRIPTTEELISLYKLKPTFPKFTAKWYWTSDSTGGFIKVVVLGPRGDPMVGRVEPEAYGAVRAVRPSITRFTVTR